MIIALASDLPVLANDNPDVKFHMANQKILLTYPCLYEDKDGLEVHFRTKHKTYASSIKVFRVSFDFSEEHGEFTHVLIDWGRIFQSKNAKIFNITLDGEIYWPLIRIIKNPRQWNVAAAFMAAADDSNRDLLDNDKKNFPGCEAIWKAKTISEAVDKHARGFADVNAIITLMSLRESMSYKPDIVPDKPWQLEIMSLDGIEPDDRTIYWYYDKTGGIGKTKFGLYMMHTTDKQWFLSTNVETTRDAATTIAGAVMSGWQGKAWIMDLPRNIESRKSIYDYLEKLKNGLITTQKYRGQTITFRPPHVIVFANWPPSLTVVINKEFKDRLSMDRWAIREIIDGKAVPIDAYQLKERQIEEAFSKAPLCTKCQCNCGGITRPINNCGRRDERTHPPKEEEWVPNSMIMTDHSQ